MTPTPEVQERLRRYVLGQLAEDARAELEKGLLANDELFEELLAIEDEIIDDYLGERLNASDRAAFENHFLATPERHEQLKFGRAFDRYLSRQAAVARKSETGVSTSRPWSRTLFSSPLRIAFAAILLIGISLGAWQIFFKQSEVDKGLLALNAAYREQRPVESRISGLDYAHYSATRGSDNEKVDQNELRRAELILLEALKRNPTPAARHALGKVFLAKKDFAKAIEQFDEAVKGDPNNAQMYSDLGVAWLETGKIDRQSTAPGKAMEDFGRSVENLNKAIELNPNLLPALFNRALLYQEMQARGEAEASWKDYLQKDPGSPWSDEAKRNLKQLQENVGNTSWSPDQAVEEFLAAQKMGHDDAAWKVLTRNYTSAGNEVTNRIIKGVVEPGAAPGITEPSAALSYIAHLELVRGGDRYTSDLVNHYQGKNSEQRKILAEGLQRMRTGYALFTVSKFSNAIKEYAEARRRFAQAGDLAEQTFADYRLAHCYLFLPDLEKAEVTFKRLSVICGTRNYRWLLAQCLFGLAHASVNSNQYSQALEYSERALAAFERVGDTNGILKCLTQLADLNQVLNRIEAALGYLSKGLNQSSEMPTEPMQKWGVLNEIAFSLSSKQLHRAALIYRNEALDLALKLKRPLIISRSYGYVGMEYASLKLYPEAISAAVKAEETGASMADSTGGLEIFANASQQLADIHRHAGDCDKAIQAYDRSIDSYKKLKVEYYSYAAHKGKLLCYLRSSDDQAVGNELSQVLALAEDYRVNITEESQRLSFFSVQQSIYDLAIYYEWKRTRNPVRAFEYSEISRARSLLDQIRLGAQVSRKSDQPRLKLPAVTRSMSLEEIKRGIPADSQILQYAVLNDRLLAWVVNSSAIHYIEVPIGSEQLSQKVRTYLDSVNKAPSNAENGLTKAAEDLYRLLVLPVEPFLDKSKYLCIVSDKMLHYLPYNTLISPVTAKYLMEDYDIGSAPSASTFVYLTRSAQQKAGAFEENLLSVGNPRFNRAKFGSLVELPSAATEAETVSDFYKNSRVLLREEATETAIRAGIEKANVAHLATHYVLQDRAEMLSGFPVTPENSAGERESANGFLQSYEIYGMNLRRTRLVVLSACQTGIEQQYGGEGAVSAARPFIVAGVPSIIASLWPVDSASSARLMANFHSYRIRGTMPTTRALRQAQIDMARGPDTRYQHPYYWAAFLAIGGHTSY